MRYVVGVTGASGLLYAERLLRFLSTTEHAVDLIVSTNARRVNKQECGMDFSSFGYPVYADDAADVPALSGSQRYEGGAIVPCSMATLGRIASGVAETAIARAADVFLKERRRLVLVVRESPYSLIHLRNMTQVTLAGAVVLPASPGFYTGPKTIEALVDTIVARVLDLLGIEHALCPPWTPPGE
ncbi:MAG: UbiX family flavin prenyltransferase [Verrucomicrobia bacterium]|nr:UbiX family flavin prenyltransferase [Verrucomicrobiota bacterium]